VFAADALALSEVIASLLDGFAGVVAGDRVLLVTSAELEVDADVLVALAEGIRGRGAAARELTTPRFDPRTQDAPAGLAEAMAEADVLIDLAEHESLVHTATARTALRERALRLVAVSLRSRADWLSRFARYPLERLFARAGVAAGHLAAGGRARLTTPAGTDLRFDVVPGRVRGMPGGARPAPMRRGQGGFGLFPPGAIGTSPERASGTIVLDGLVGFRGPLVQRLTLQVANGFVTDVSGGAEADWLRAKIAAHDNGGFVAKLLAGINPAAPIEAGLRELDRRKARLSRGEGVTLVGLGDARSVGGTVASSWHWDGVVLPPVTWELEGRTLFASGVLQGPPEIVRDDEGVDVAPHNPRPLARAGELVVMRVDCRGDMPHSHRNLESDELWLPLAGPPLRVLLEGEAPRALGLGEAALIPRGVAHRVCGEDEPSPMLVIERLPPAPLPRPESPAPYQRFDLPALGAAPTGHWSRPPATLATTASFAVELYARPEGMLRPRETLEHAELWLPLRGGIAIEWEDGPAQAALGRGEILSLPAGAAVRVISVQPDTVALRIRPA
jgi:hypothetical protein